MDLFDLAEPVDKSDILESLDAQQRAAATAGNGGVIVRAGAGTGKTRTLVARILYLIRDCDIPPYAIMAVTFTNKAAREIRERIGHILGVEQASQIRLGTFHALSLRFLRRYPELAGLKPKFKIASEEDCLLILRSVIEKTVSVSKDMDAENKERTYATLQREAWTTINRWKAWGLTVEEADDPTRERRGEQEEAIARLYVAYQAEMAAQNRVDFGDLVLKTVAVMRSNEELCYEESRRIRHLLVDEAQDANPAQVAWVQLMAFSYGNVFAVGDEDQSIFSFQGGYPGAIRDLAGSDATEYSLTLNRRCTEQILAPAVKLVGWNRRAAPKVLQSGVVGSPVGMRLAGGEREEATALVAAVKADIEAGTPKSEIAVLVRSGWIMPPLEEAFLKANIDYEVIGGHALTKREEVLDIIAYMKLILDPYDIHAFKRVGNKPARGIGPAAEKDVQDFLGNGMTVIEACRRVDRGAEKTLQGLSHFASVLEILHEDGEATTLDLLRRILAKDGFDYLAHLSGSAARKRKRRENIAILERLAEEEPDPHDFINEVALASDDDAHRKTDAVRISTMHSSKGLEWDVVYCPGFEMDVVPNKRAISDVVIGTPGNPWAGPSGGGFEEERRLVHVAFTRARKKLHISCAMSRSGRTQSPSPFIPESGLDPLMESTPVKGMKPPLRKARESRGGPKAGRKGFGRGFDF